MAKRRSKIVHRTATRRPDLQVAREPGAVPSVAAGTAAAELAAVEALFAQPGMPQDKVSALRVLTDPQTETAQQIAAMSTELLDGILACRRPLEVEVLVASLLGMAARTAPEDADPAEIGPVQELLLTATGEAFAAVGGAAGLAGLRALAAIGPADSRSLSARYAGRLAADGVPEPRWAAAIGRPAFVRAWRYGDVYGSQTSVGMLFEYGGREHALLVLIDHTLGGGVKDCFLVEGRPAARLRDQVRDQMEAEPEARFEDVDATAAAETLGEALAVEPCPVQDDQVEDVATYLSLLRSRTALVAELAGRAAPTEAVTAAALDAGSGSGDATRVGGLLRLRVSIEGISPPVWRSLEVPAELTLSRLHTVLQTAFGWEGMHPHAFEILPPLVVRQRLRDAGPEPLPEPGERRTRVGQLLREPGDELIYRYDFGDDWEHRIVVESRAEDEDGVASPRCTGGARNAPPEDCGGVPGYEHLLQVLARPGHPEYADLADWMPEGFDPDAFSAQAVDAELARLR